MTGTGSSNAGLISLRLAQEGIRKKAAAQLRQASEHVQTAARILTDAGDPTAPIVALTTQAVCDGIAEADVSLRRLARQLEHHGQRDLFGGGAA